jgi:hypothetical protein
MFGLRKLSAEQEIRTVVRNNRVRFMLVTAPGVIIFITPIAAATCESVASLALPG